MPENARFFDTISPMIKRRFGLHSIVTPQVSLPGLLAALRLARFLQDACEAPQALRRPEELHSIIGICATVSSIVSYSGIYQWKRSERALTRGSCPHFSCMCS